MSKRLQVVLENDEWDELRAAAKARGLTLSAWVRQELAEARRRSSGRDVGAKRKALQAATAHDFPVGDIDDILADIARGYAGTPE